MTDGSMSLEELTEEVSTLQIDIEGAADENLTSGSELHSDDLATSSLSSVSVASDISYYILDWRSKTTPSSVSRLYISCKELASLVFSRARRILGGRDQVSSFG